MPSFSADFSEAVEFRLIDRGWYHVRVQAVEVGEAKSSGNPRLRAVLKILAGEETGVLVSVNWPLTGRGAGITKGVFRALLGTSEEVSNTDDLIECECEVYNAPRIWAEEEGGDGELQNNISRYRSIKTEGVVDFAG